MQNGLRSSSSSRLALLALAGVLGLAGCTAGAGLLTNSGKPADLRLVTLDTEPEMTASTTKPEAIQKITDGVEIRPATFVETDDPSSSAWCKYLEEDSAAEATILRSPTVSGKVDDGGKAAVSLGVSVSSFTKARLIEQAAQVKCRRYLAETGLQKLAFVTPQGLTAAGFQAKSTSILQRKAELAELRQQIKYELRRGNLTVEKATSLSVLIDQINAEGNAAKSQADRRLAEGLGNPLGADVLGEDLIKAEAELEDINSRIRTADAMDLSISAGWNDDGLRDGFDVHDDSFSGKVSFSIKLGALAPQRFAHERRARDAKVRAIRDQEGGALWQIQMLHKAHQRALAGLAQSQAKLKDALADAHKLVKVLNSAQSPEFVGILIGAKIQVVRLLADKAAIDGSIEEIEQNLKRLNIG
ncbi:MAG: hypothetical protein WCB71_13275 [Aestuariivirga sp.]